MTVTITLTSAGLDTGPFNLYSDLDGYSAAFETGISRSTLLAGYTTSAVPNGTNFIKVLSTGNCTNFVFIPVTFTTTTTTTNPDPPTSTLTFFSYESGIFTFTLSDPIYSTGIEIVSAAVDGSTSVTDCSVIDEADTITTANSVKIDAGEVIGSSLGNNPFTCAIVSYKKLDSIFIDGYGSFIDGDTVTIGGTLVTISIPSVCTTPYPCSTFTEWEGSRSSNSFLTVCSQPPTTVYTPFGQPISPGVIVYTDSGLTTPLLEKSYIVDPVNNAIYNISSVSGLVGTFTNTFCS
jgi:hypothetical protein